MLCEAEQEEAEREADPGDLLPEDAEADLRPEGAAGAGGGGGDLDEGPQRQRPGEEGDGGGQAGGVLGRGGEDGRRPVPAFSVISSAIRMAGSDRDEQRQLDRAMGARLAVLGRHDPLQRAGHRQVDDVGDQAHRAPEHDIDAVGRDPEQPGVERLRQRLDQRPGAGEPGQAGAARNFAAGDGGWRRGGASP